MLAASRADVAALVLIDSIAFDLWPTQAMTELQVLSKDRETFETIDVAIRTAFGWACARQRLRRTTFGPTSRPGSDADAVPAFFRWARALDGLGLRELESQMRGWDLPTLILWGEEDPFHPPEIGERLNDAIASSALGLVPETGHFLPEEVPGDDLSDHLGIPACQLSSDTARPCRRRSGPGAARDPGLAGVRR